MLRQQKDYQSVVAPFDGIVTQRNIDIGSLVQAELRAALSCSPLMQTDVIRTQVYVPQDRRSAWPPESRRWCACPRTARSQRFPAR